MKITWTGIKVNDLLRQLRGILSLPPCTPRKVLGFIIKIIQVLVGLVTLEKIRFYRFECLIFENNPDSQDKPDADLLKEVPSRFSEISTFERLPTEI